MGHLQDKRLHRVVFLHETVRLDVNVVGWCIVNISPCHLHNKCSVFLRGLTCINGLSRRQKHKEYEKEKASETLDIHNGSLFVLSFLVMQEFQILDFPFAMLNNSHGVVLGCVWRIVKPAIRCKAVRHDFVGELVKQDDHLSLKRSGGVYRAVVRVTSNTKRAGGVKRSFDVYPDRRERILVGITPNVWRCLEEYYWNTTYNIYDLLR